MKQATYIFLGCVITYLFFSFAYPKKEGASELLTIGAKAPLPEYSMLDISGEKLTLADVKKDKGLLVVFSCNTCPFVIAWEDRYQTVSALCKELNIGMIAINSNEAKRDGEDSIKKMKAHAKEKNYNFYYTVDENSKLAKAFGATKTPQIFLFDNKLSLVYTGAIDDNLKNAKGVQKHYLKNALSNLANGIKIDPESTKALGCSIKKVKTAK